MIDPQQKVTLEVNPIELWILYHRVNQNHQNFWYGNKGINYARKQQDIANDVGEYQETKHNLWMKISNLMNNIGMNAGKTIGSQLEIPIQVNDRTVGFENNGDISVGCEDISYDQLKQVYEKATGLRKGK